MARTRDVISPTSQFFFFRISIKFLRLFRTKSIFLTFLRLTGILGRELLRIKLFPHKLQFQDFVLGFEFLFFYSYFTKKM